MAITFVNAGAEAAAASGGITLAAPATPQNDDIWIAVVHTSDQIAMTMLATDWTSVGQGNGGGTTSRIGVWWHRYAGVTPDLSVTHALGATIIGGIAAFRGVTTSQPIDAVSNILGGTDASIEIEAITTTVANTMLVAVDGSADDNNRSPVPSGFSVAFEDSGGGTQNSYHSTAGTPDGSVACFYKAQAATGDTGGFTDTQAAADAWASFLFALAPAATTTNQTLAATEVSVASLTRLTSAFRTLAATEVSVPTILKQVGKSMSVTSVGVVTMVSAFVANVTMAATEVGVATLSQAASFLRTLISTAVSIASLATLFIPGGGAGPVFRRLRRRWYRKHS